MNQTDTYVMLIHISCFSLKYCLFYVAIKAGCKRIDVLLIFLIKTLKGFFSYTSLLALHIFYICSISQLNLIPRFINYTAKWTSALLNLENISLGTDITCDALQEELLPSQTANVLSGLTYRQSYAYTT